jgi:hypothetical protein
VLHPPLLLQPETLPPVPHELHPILYLGLTIYKILLMVGRKTHAEIKAGVIHPSGEPGALIFVQLRVIKL